MVSDMDVLFPHPTGCRNSDDMGIPREAKLKTGGNMFEIIESDGLPIKSWTRGVPVEESAKQQLRNLAVMPFIHKHVAVMPDVHLGIGATIGSVIATNGAIIPAAVGVDLGCGMMACRLNLEASDLPDNLFAVRSAIESAIPVGRTDNGGKNDLGAWNEIPKDVAEAYGRIKIERALGNILENHPKLLSGNVNIERHLGTLGTGNHFIEMCLDESGGVWLMLHSGSRGIGNRIGSYFIELAKRDMEKWFINLPDKDLAYFPEGTEHFNDYCDAVSWAQKFARLNREVMMARAIDAVALALSRPVAASETAVNCHHNYVSHENHFGANVWVTRKGAVRAREGDLGIIPGSMGAKSFIVSGKGNKDSFCSCSHGAGRSMSRGEARRKFTLEDHAKATDGVECRKDAEVLDETPAAYKDIDAVMAAQSDLVEVVRTLKQVVCVKG